MKVHQMLILSVAFILLGIGQASAFTAAPLYYQNLTATNTYTNGYIALYRASNTFYPFELYALPNSIGGNSITYNLNYTATPPGLSQVNNPSSINSTYYQVTYTTSTVLTGNITAYDIKINGGVTVTTAGHSMLASNAFNNLGTIITGTQVNGGAGTSSTPSQGNPGTGNVLSYAGAGGGGGSGGACGPDPGGNGGSTQAAGGGQGNCGGGPYAGGSYISPTINNANIQLWTGNLGNYLGGAGGGGGGSSSSPGGAGGGGAYGCYIQANTLNAGNINVQGATGISLGDGAGGGGGSGICILAYGTSLTTGTNTVTGALGGSNGWQSGGQGGNGAVLGFHYATQPISLTTPLLTGFTANVFTGVANYTYFLPPTSFSGNYEFRTKEMWLANSLSYNVIVQTNMLTYNSASACIPGLTTASTPLQYAPQQYNALTNNCWNGIPSAYSINTYSNSSSAGVIASKGSASTTMPFNIRSTFGQFSPAYSFNLTIQTGMNLGEINLNPFVISYASNALGFVTRNVIMIQNYNQTVPFASINALDSVQLRWFYNGYTGTTTVLPLASNSVSFFTINSAYVNPAFSFTNVSVTATAANYIPVTDNFPAGSVATGAAPVVWKVYLPNTAAQGFIFNVYQCDSYAGSGYTMVASSGPTAGNLTNVQYYNIPPTSYTISYVLSQLYEFLFYGPNGNLVYTILPGTFSPSSPAVSINVPCILVQTPPPVPSITAACTSTYVGNTVSCGAVDNSHIVSQWHVQIVTHPTIVSTHKVYTSNAITGNPLAFTYSVPNNTSEYYLSINATVDTAGGNYTSGVTSYAFFGGIKGLSPGLGYDGLLGIILFLGCLGVFWITPIGGIIGMIVVIALGQMLGVYALSLNMIVTITIVGAMMIGIYLWKNREE